MRVVILTSSTSSATASEIRSAVNSISITNARARIRRGLRRAQQQPLSGLIQRARSGLRRLVATHVRPSELQTAIQRIQRRQRQIHRGRRRPPLDLQPASEIPGGVIARDRIGQRIALPAIAVRRLRQPRAVRAHIARILVS